MRAFVQPTLAFAFIGFAVLGSGRALAQADAAASANAATADEQTEEVTVRGRRTIAEYRLELEKARDEIFRVFNEVNEGNDTDIRCGAEQPTGTRTRRQVCRSNAENRASAEAGRRMLNSLFLSAQGSFARLGFGGATPQSYSNISTGNAEQAGKIGEGDALAAFEEEFKRLLSSNRDLYNAVAHYAEVEAEYAQARGDTATPPGEALTAALDAVPAAAPTPASAAQCEASTLTDYQQRNNVARVSGKVSFSMCPAGTTGSFTVVARVRDEAGEIKPLEFNETWQRADPEDHNFQTDYPIGENVELLGVRVRNLKCTCADAAQ